MNRLSKTFLGILIALFLGFFFLPKEAFAADDCFPYSLCLEKQQKMDKDGKSNPFAVTVSLLKEPVTKKGKEKTPNNTSNTKVAFTQFAHPLNPEVLFKLINDYRIKINLPAFQKEERVCEIAKERTNEIHDEIFVTGRLHAGFYARNLSFFATENLIYAQTEEKALNWWLNSPIHKAAISSNHKYSCLECSENSCSQIFTSFDPKKTS